MPISAVPYSSYTVEFSTRLKDLHETRRRPGTLLVRTRVVDAKTAALGKAMEASAIFEMRMSQPASSKILRESKHELVGESIGRADSDKTRMSLEALKPALDKWVALVVDQVAPKP